MIEAAFRKAALQLKEEGQSEANKMDASNAEDDAKPGAAKLQAHR